MALGASVQIFLPNGSTDGIWVVQKSNWTGVGLVIPRNHFSDGRLRDELAGPGVYVLAGAAEGEAFDQRVYIGESETLKTRLDGHMKSQDFWTRALVFAAKDGNLNKAHIRHLESRLIALARDAGRVEVANGTGGSPVTLAEAEAAMVEGFLLEMLTLYPVMGLSAFDGTSPEAKTNRTMFYCSGPDAQAQGYETSDGFVVVEGSLLRRRATESQYPTVRKRVEAMHADNLLEIVNETQFRLVTDHLFTSPSLAADVVLGRSANGRTEWRTSDGITLKAIQEHGLDGS